MQNTVENRQALARTREDAIENVVTYSRRFNFNLARWWLNVAVNANDHLKKLHQEENHA